MIVSFQAHALRQLEEVGEAISAGDAVAVAQRSHKLAGLVSAFSRSCAREVALLEEMAQNSDLAAAVAQHGRLREAIERLAPALNGLEIANLRNSQHSHNNRTPA